MTPRVFLLHGKTTKFTKKVHGDNPSKEDADMFIDSYISNNNLDLSQITQDLQKKSGTISFEYIRRANAIFGITLPPRYNSIRNY